MVALFGKGDNPRPNRMRVDRRLQMLADEVDSLRDRLAVAEEARATAERVSGEMHRMAHHLDLELEKFRKLAREVVAIDRKLDEGEQAAEAQRLKLVALAKEFAWETESTRKSIQVLFEQSIIKPV